MLNSYDGRNFYNNPELPAGVTCGISACVDANGNLWDPYTEPDYGPDPGANNEDLDYDVDDFYDSLDAEAESFDDLDGSGGGGGDDDDDYLGLNFYDDEGNFDLDSQDYA